MTMPLDYTGLDGLTPELQTALNERVVAAEKAAATAAEARAAELNEELNNVQSSATLSKEEKEALTQRLETIRGENTARVRQLESTNSEISKKYKEETEELSQRLTDLQGRYDNDRINASIISEASTGKAINPKQVLAILQPRTRMTDILDDDQKPTGRQAPKVNWTDAKGEEMVMDVADAVKYLREQPDYSNLWQDTSTGGLGGSNVNGDDVDLATLARTNTAAYREHRKKNHA